MQQHLTQTLELVALCKHSWVLQWLSKNSNTKDSKNQEPEHESLNLATGVIRDTFNIWAALITLIHFNSRRAKTDEYMGVGGL